MKRLPKGNLINVALRLKYVPSVSKTIEVMIYKPEKQPNGAKSYKPILLLHKINNCS